MLYQCAIQKRLDVSRITPSDETKSFLVRRREARHFPGIHARTNSPRFLSLPVRRCSFPSGMLPNKQSEIEYKKNGALDRSAELLQLVAQAAQVQVDVRSVSLHREQLRLISVHCLHLQFASKVPRVDARHGEAVSQSGVVVAHHGRVGQQIINVSTITVDLVATDRMRCRVRVELVLLALAHELVLVEIDMAIQVQVVLRLIVVPEVPVDPWRRCRRRVRVVPHLRHLRSRNAATQIRNLPITYSSLPYLDGDVVLAVGDDHIHRLGLLLPQLRHLLHRGAHRVLHDLEDHVMHVRGNVVERSAHHALVSHSPHLLREQDSHRRRLPVELLRQRRAPVDRLLDRREVDVLDAAAYASWIGGRRTGTGQTLHVLAEKHDDRDVQRHEVVQRHVDHFVLEFRQRVLFLLVIVHSPRSPARSAFASAGTHRQP